MSFQVAGHQTEGYIISTEVFEGPLDLLLNLIEHSELDITTLALAKVTDQYLAHLQTLKNRDPAEVSAFLVIAARLVQIKSAVLLPRPPASAQTADEEDPGELLALQLIQYRRFKQLAAWLQQREEAGMHTYLRLNAPPIKLDTHADLSDFSLQDLARLAREIFVKQTDLEDLAQVVSMSRVTIREKINLILEALKAKGNASFRRLVHSGSKLDLVITFLALLELIKRNAVIAEQTMLFGDIAIQPAGVLEQPAELEFED